jgi:hypothetical protein
LRIKLKNQISLFFPKIISLSDWVDLYPDCFIRAADPVSADFVVVSAGYADVTNLDLSVLNKTIVFLQTAGSARKILAQDMRSGRFVDEPALSPVVKDILMQAAMVFTMADLRCSEYGFVGVPLSYIDYTNISQPPFYWANILDTDCARKSIVYWSGSQFTHESRKIINSLQECSNQLYDLNDWKPKSIDGQDAKVYGPIKPHPNEYLRFIETLRHVQACLVIRGDLPWVYSFLDVVRAGSIPIFIDTAYPDLGWEKIGYQINETFMAFDTRHNSVQDIDKSIHELLSNQSWILLMRKNIISFYEKFIKTDRFFLSKKFHGLLTGWSDFYVAKIIERKLGIVSSSLFSAQVFEVKGIDCHD